MGVYMFKKLRIKKAYKYLESKQLYAWKNDLSAKDILFGLMKRLNIEPIHYKNDGEISQAMVNIIYSMESPDLFSRDHMENKYFIEIPDKSYYRYKAHYEMIRCKDELAACLEIVQTLYMFSLNPTERYLFGVLRDIREYISSSNDTKTVFNILNTVLSITWYNI